MALFYYQVPPKTAVTAALGTTEARDAAAFNVSDPNLVTLATTEAKDTAAFNATDKNIVTLGTTEAQDTAAFQVTSPVQAALATTEAADVAAIAVSDPSAAAVFDYGGGSDYWIKEWLKRRRQARKEQEENTRAGVEPRLGGQKVSASGEKPLLGRQPEPAPPVSTRIEPVGRTFAELRQALETDRALEAERMEQEDEEAVAYFVAHLEDA
jgi:hypothetical protein